MNSRENNVPFAHTKRGKKFSLLNGNQLPLQIILFQFTQSTAACALQIEREPSEYPSINKVENEKKGKRDPGQPGLFSPAS